MKYEEQRKQLLALKEQHKQNVAQNIENIKAQLDVKQRIALMVGGGFLAGLLIFKGVQAVVLGKKKSEKTDNKSEKNGKKTVVGSLSDKVSDYVADTLFDFGKRLISDFFERINQNPTQKK